MVRYREDAAVGGGGHKIGGGKFDPNLHPHGHHGMFKETTGGKPKPAAPGAAAAKAPAAPKAKPKKTAAAAAEPKAKPAKPGAADKPEHVKAARAAVDKAKKEPTKENVAAARDAVTKARGKRSGDDKIDVRKTKDPQAERKPQEPAPTKTAHEVGVERIKQAEASKPRADGDLIDAIGNGGVRHPDNGRLIGLNEEAQAAVRGHFAAQVQKEGMRPRPQAQTQAHILASRTSEEMGSSYGLYYPQTGRIEVSDVALGHLGYMAQDHAYDKSALRRDFASDPGHRSVEGYNTMIHETIHGHGPDMRTGAAHHYQLAEEMSTEMAARHVTSKALGIEGHKMIGGYDDVMKEAVGHVAHVAGASHEDAFNALAGAAIEHKRRSGTVDAADAIRNMASTAMHKLGNDDVVAHAQLNHRFLDLAEEMKKRYPWP